MRRDAKKLRKRYPGCDPEIYAERMMDFAQWWKGWIFERAAGKGVCEKKSG
jgi:hypothetical protein